MLRYACGISEEGQLFGDVKCTSTRASGRIVRGCLAVERRSDALNPARAGARVAGWMSLCWTCHGLGGGQEEVNMRSGVPSPSRACVCVLMQVCGSRKDAVGSEKEEERPVSLLLSVPGYSARSLERGGSGLLLLLLPSTRPIEHEPWPWPRAGFLAMQSYVLNDDCRPAGHTCAQSNKVPCFRRSSPEPLISCLDVQALSAGRLSFRPLGLEQRKRPKGTAQRRRIRRRRARRRSVNDTARHEGPSPYCPLQPLATLTCVHFQAELPLSYRA